MTLSLQETEWAPADSQAGSPYWSLVGLAPVGIAGAIGWATVGFPAAVGVAAVATAAIVVWARVQGRLALRSVRAARMGQDQGARLRNVTDGLAAAAGMEPPELWLIRDGGPNALVCRAGRPVIAVTASLIEGYSRLELEAVAAHCISRVPELGMLSAAVALGPLGRRAVGIVGEKEDAGAVALTRYPPALAIAIEKAQPTTTRFGLFCFVGGPDTHEPQSERARGLMDL